MWGLILQSTILCNGIAILLNTIQASVEQKKRYLIIYILTTVLISVNVIIVVISCSLTIFETVKNQIKYTRDNEITNEFFSIWFSTAIFIVHTILVAIYLSLSNANKILASYNLVIMIVGIICLMQVLCLFLGKYRLYINTKNLNNQPPNYATLYPNLESVITPK